MCNCMQTQYFTNLISQLKPQFDTAQQLSVVLYINKFVCVYIIFSVIYVNIDYYYYSHCGVFWQR